MKCGAALVLACSEPVSAGVKRWAGEIHAASQRFGIPDKWIREVMRAESGGNESLVSRAGAMGLMQLMPTTWAEMRLELGLGQDPFNPRDNIIAGVAYLRVMHDRFGYPGLFAAYNAGPRRFAEYLLTGRPLPRETVGYLAKLVGPAPRSREAGQPLRGLFVIRRATIRARSEPQATDIFACCRKL